MIEIVITEIELHDGDGMLAKIEMEAGVAALVKIENSVNPDNWQELSDAILIALKQMFP